MKTRPVMVRIDFSIEVPQNVKDDFTEEDIDYYFNHGRLCLSQVMQDVSNKIACLCEETKVVYLREATQEDLDHYEKRLWRNLMTFSK